MAPTLSFGISRAAIAKADARQKIKEASARDRDKYTA